MKFSLKKIQNYNSNITKIESIPSLSEEGGRYLLRPTPGNILYKSVPRGNPQIEDNPEYPQYYNNNFPIQSVIRYENRLTKGIQYYLTNNRNVFSSWFICRI